ncbi:MAG TPA: hypothetical protein VIH61_09110 [Waddliaceae bacterium]
MFDAAKIQDAYDAIAVIPQEDLDIMMKVAMNTMVWVRRHKEFKNLDNLNIPTLITAMQAYRMAKGIK